MEGRGGVLLFLPFLSVLSFGGMWWLWWWCGCGRGGGDGGVVKPLVGEGGGGKEGEVGEKDCLLGLAQHSRLDREEEALEELDGYLVFHRRGSSGLEDGAGDGLGAGSVFSCQLLSRC